MKLCCSFSLLVVLSMTATSNAQSLWQQRNDRFAHFFEDPRARRVGDILTIVIDENTNVQKRDQRALDKSSDGSFGFDFAGASSSGAASSANVNMSGDSSRAFDGNSQYRVNQAFSDQIAVTVQQVFPNGYLKVRGTRTRVVSGERRTLVISGFVRPNDIMPNNTIRTQFVANLAIEYVGTGVETSFTNQGWAGRAITRIWPF